MSDDEPGQGLARRTLLRIAGASAALSIGGVAVGQETPAEDETPEDPTGDESAGAPPPIDPAFGYPGGPDDELPDEYEPDATVSLRTLTQSGTVLGDFAFDPVGLSVETDAVVRFEASAPEHTVTGYHEAQGRSHRVPDGIPPLSSPVLAEDGFWLYRFTEPGVYDLFCASHEFYGMVMRVVVGEADEWTVERDEDGRPPFGSAQELFDRSELAPEAIVEAGSVDWADLDLDAGGDAGTGANETDDDGNGTTDGDTDVTFGG